MIYVGTKGVMVTGTYGDNPRILPKDKHDKFPPPEKTLARSKSGVKGDLIAACKGSPEPSSSFDYAGPFTEFVLTGVMASRAGAGKTITWDVEKMQADLPEANALGESCELPQGVGSVGSRGHTRSQVGWPRYT